MLNGRPKCAQLINLRGWKKKKKPRKKDLKQNRLPTFWKKIKAHKTLQTNIFFNRTPRGNVQIFHEFPLLRANKHRHSTCKMKILMLIYFFCVVVACVEKKSALVFAVARWGMTNLRRSMTDGVTALLLWPPAAERCKHSVPVQKMTAINSIGIRVYDTPRIALHTLNGPRSARNVSLGTGLGGGRFGILHRNQNLALYLVPRCIRLCYIQLRL